MTKPDRTHSAHKRPLEWGRVIKSQEDEKAPPIARELIGGAFPQSERQDLNLRPLLPQSSAL
jgi:hypothetical protein